MWLPSAGLFSNRGVLVSGYEWRVRPEFAGLDLKGKFEASRASIEKLHTGHGKELEKPIYVGWAMIPYNEGAWIETYGPGQHGGQLLSHSTGPNPATRR